MGFLDNFKKRQPNYDSASQEYMQNISLLNPDVQLAIMGKISPNDLNTQIDYVKPQESVNNDRWANNTRTPYGSNETIYINGQKTTTNEIDPELCYNTNKHVVGYGKNGEVIYETIIPYGDNKERGETRIASEEEKNNSAFSTDDGSTVLFNGEQGSVSSTKYQNSQIESPSQSENQIVESSPTNEVGTAQEAPGTKSIKSVEFQIDNQKKDWQQFMYMVGDILEKRSDKRKYTSDYYKTGEINYIKKVSLNVAPITKLNVANGMSKTEWETRAGYVLGDSSGLLYNIFHDDWGIVFPYTPKVDFEHSVNYERTEIMHSNLAVSHYKNTPPPSITIQADFTADGEDNARYMFGVIHFLRSISKCEFGEKMLSDKREKAAGVPPPILYLNGYGNFMNNIPVVVQSFGINFDKNKHYVHLNNPDVWLPTDITISIKLEIQFNLEKYKLQFDLNEYKKNTLGYNDNTLAVVKYQSFEEIGGQEITTYSDNSSSKASAKGWSSFDREKTVRLNGSGWTW